MFMFRSILGCGCFTYFICRYHLNIAFRLYSCWWNSISFCQDDHISTEAQKIGAGHVAANTVRLLIAGTQAGGLIGASGQNIENLRNSSGATITVLGQNQMPLCASVHESDRVVQVRRGLPWSHEKVTVTYFMFAVPDMMSCFCIIIGSDLHNHKRNFKIPRASDSINLTIMFCSGIFLVVDGWSIESLTFWCIEVMTACNLLLLVSSLNINFFIFVGN